MGNKETAAQTGDREVRALGAGDIGAGAAKSATDDAWSDNDVEPDEEITPLPGGGLFHLRTYGDSGMLLYPSTVVSEIGRIAARRIAHWRNRAERRRYELIVTRRDRIDLQRRIDHARDVLSMLKHSHGRVPKGKMVERIAAALGVEL